MVTFATIRAAGLRAVLSSVLSPDQSRSILQHLPRRPPPGGLAAVRPRAGLLRPRGRAVRERGSAAASARGRSLLLPRFPR
eukprot:7351199-Pyramimonas_sp.AAC.1